MQHIGLHVFGRECSQVKAQAHALRQLHQFRRIQLRIQLWLSRQDDAQHLLLGGLDAGEHAHLFECAQRQVLRLVDDQQHLWRPRTARSGTC